MKREVRGSYETVFNSISDVIKKWYDNKSVIVALDIWSIGQGISDKCRWDKSEKKYHFYETTSKLNHLVTSDSLDSGLGISPKFMKKKKQDGVNWMNAQKKIQSYGVKCNFWLKAEIIM